MKHKTADLSGALLDAAVAKAMELREVEIITDGRFDPWVKVRESPREGLGLVDVPGGWLFSPSKLWQCGGPILFREGIGTCPSPDHQPGAFDAWCAAPGCLTTDEIIPGLMFGFTPLEAGMRAYVSSRLGDEVEL